MTIRQYHDMQANLYLQQAAGDERGVVRTTRQAAGLTVGLLCLVITGLVVLGDEVITTVRITVVPLSSALLMITLAAFVRATTVLLSAQRPVGWRHGRPVLADARFRGWVARRALLWAVACGGAFLAWGTTTLVWG